MDHKMKRIYVILTLTILTIILYITGCERGVNVMPGGTVISGGTAMPGGTGSSAAAGTAASLKISEAGTVFLSSVDVKAEKLKKNILNSKTSIKVTGTAYYISNSGDDGNDGKSPENAWATLSKVNDANLAYSDAVLFERGGLWRGQLKTKGGVTYSAYGKGDKPKLYGSSQAAVPALWSATAAENVYVYAVSLPFSNEPGNLIFNEGEAYGVKKFLGEREYWISRYPEVEDFTGINDLDEDLEFYHDIPSGKLYLYSAGGNPGERYSSVEIAHKPHTIRNGGNDVTIDNLCIKYTGSHGIASGTCKGLTVTNCEFAWIGGSIQTESKPYYRFGNAVEIYGGCDGYTVENCYIYQVYDAGVTHQLSTSKDSVMKNVRYAGNLFEYCTYSIEYFLGQTAGNSPVLLMSGIRIENNICRYAGYGWGDQRPNKKEAAHIKTWDGSINPAEDFIIEGNIFDRGKYMLVHISASVAASLPAMKGNTYIQRMDGEFGKYGIRSSGLVMFDKNIGNFIGGVLKDTDATVRYLIK